MSDVLEPIFGNSWVKDFCPKFNEVFEQKKTNHTERKEEGEDDCLEVIDTQIYSSLNSALSFQFLQFWYELISKEFLGLFFY